MKHIVITGASSGIGMATASLLARKGYKLTLGARNLAKLEEIKANFPQLIQVKACDVRNYDEVTSFVEFALKVNGPIDALINNAGLGYFDTVIGGKIEEWHEMFDTNVKGLLNCLHVCLPHLIASTGHVINLGSVASHNVFANSGVYCATKHAVFAISESLRLELPDKLRVTTISPGSTNTAFIDKTTNEEMLKNYKDYFAAGMSADVIAQQIHYALECPKEAVISEIIIRPNRASK
jgi:NADP-dependent 3-hydroxy acid dehydrogenase YdfG